MEETEFQEDVQMNKMPLFLPYEEDIEEQSVSVVDLVATKNASIFHDARSSASNEDEPLMYEEEKSSVTDLVSIPPSSPKSENVQTSDETMEISPDVGQSSKFQDTSAAPRKRRRLSESKKKITKDIYLGSFLVGNAWSTVRGSGYVKPGDTILVERDVTIEENSSSFDTKKKGKAKQATISSMFKVKGAPVKSSRISTVVRLANERGFEFGRLPSDVAAWVSRLLDLDIICFKGSTIIDCPEKLYSGADLIVSLSVYIRPAAFKRYKVKSDSQVNVKFWFNEGQETTEEEVLRDRKTSLQQLFKTLGLKPHAGNALVVEKENVPPPGGSVLEKHNGTAVEEGEDEAEILSQNELDVIYKRAQANDLALSEMDPAESFSLTLRPYQKQALSWMYARETGTFTARQTRTMHPLWAEYLFPPEPNGDCIDLTSEDTPFYFNAHSGELSLEFPLADNLCRGGILADVGMGKTIMVSSLLQTNRGEEEIDLDEPVRDKQSKPKQLRLDTAFKVMTKPKKALRKSRATLVVTPASLVDQWASELQRSSKKGTFNITIWHGSNREDIDTLIDIDDGIDIVITSYGTLAAEHAKLDKNKSVPIFEVMWYRVVLDEAHNCKTRTSKTARAVFELKAGRRWALTGTPIVNRLEDLYSLLKFLQFAPWSDYAFFRSVVTLPFLNHEPKAIEVVQVILESVLLRREKNMRDRDGKRIVELPSKQVDIENLEFSPLERRIYDSIYQRAKHDFDSLNDRGLVGKSYTHILAMLLRLRRAVLHPSLVLIAEENKSSEPAVADGPVDVNEMIQQFTSNEEDSSANETFMQDVIKNLNETDGQECPICLDIMETPVLIPVCVHKCCKDCILGYLQARLEKDEEGQCPTCRRGPIKESDLLEVVKRQHIREASIGIAPDSADNQAESSSTTFELRRNNFKSSTKLNALLHHLKRLRDQDPCFRAVIVSQFTSFLDLIELAVQRDGFDWYRLDGSTEIRKRQQVITAFSSLSRQPKVMLLSLKAGGVGLNLTAANHVFMMDCWWNAAIEQQAIDRVHRIGQAKTVYVKHFIVADTIEGRVLEIQKRKTAIIKEALKGQGGADSESVENLKIMFGEA